MAARFVGKWYRAAVSSEAPHDRRKHVRTRPTADFEVEVWLIEGIVTERLRVVDVSVAGFGLLLEAPLEHKQRDDQVRLRISVHHESPIETDAVVRHVTTRTHVCGVEIDRDNEPAMRLLNLVVSELLERASG